MKRKNINEGKSIWKQVIWKQNKKHKISKLKNKNIYKTKIIKEYKQPNLKKISYVFGHCSILAIIKIVWKFSY